MRRESLLLAAAGLIALAGCKRQPQPAGPGAAPAAAAIAVVKPQMKPVVRVVEQPGSVQAFEETVLSAVHRSLGHLEGHMQEIIYITRLQLGDRYRFAWTPATPAQGAPARTAP